MSGVRGEQKDAFCPACGAPVRGSASGEPAPAPVSDGRYDLAALAACAARDGIQDLAPKARASQDDIERLVSRRKQAPR